MTLLSQITEQSIVPCFPTIHIFLGDHFGIDKKKKSGDHFRVGDHFGVGITLGAVQIVCNGHQHGFDSGEVGLYLLLSCRHMFSAFSQSL